MGRRPKPSAPRLVGAADSGVVATPGGRTSSGSRTGSRASSVTTVPMTPDRAAVPSGKFLVFLRTPTSTAAWRWPNGSAKASAAVQSALTPTSSCRVTRCVTSDRSGPDYLVRTADAAHTSRRRTTATRSCRATSPPNPADDRAAPSLPGPADASAQRRPGYRCRRSTRRALLPGAQSELTTDSFRIDRCSIAPSPRLRHAAQRGHRSTIECLQRHRLAPNSRVRRTTGRLESSHPHAT